MKIIELETVDSTSSYLKRLSEQQKQDDFTTVVAEFQTAGRGQMGTQWLSKKGMNLTFSTQVYFSNLQVSDQFYLSMAVSFGVLEALKKYAIADWAIKWPNDILANGRKICGLLIESSVKGTAVKSSIIGIGINVNQIDFNANIKKATSLKLIAQKDFDLKILLTNILNSIKEKIDSLVESNYESLKIAYHDNLYLFDKIATFESTNDSEIFTGKIKKVCNDGAIKIELKNGEVKKFNFKEIIFSPLEKSQLTKL